MFPRILLWIVIPSPTRRSGVHVSVINHPVGIFLNSSYDRFPLNQGIAGHVATTGETLNVEDVTLDTRFNANIDQQVDEFDTDEKM